MSARYIRLFMLWSMLVSVLQCAQKSLESSRYTAIDTQRPGVTCMIRQFAKHEKEWLLFAEDYIKVMKYYGSGIPIPSFFTSDYPYYNCIEVVIKNNTTEAITLSKNKYLLRYAKHVVDWDEALAHYASGAALWASPNSMLYIMGGLMGIISLAALFAWRKTKNAPLVSGLMAANLIPVGGAIFAGVMKKKLTDCSQKHTKLKSLKPSIKTADHKAVFLEKSDFYTVLPGETFMDILLVYQPPVAHNQPLANQVLSPKTLSF